MTTPAPNTTEVADPAEDGRYPSLDELAYAEAAERGFAPVQNVAQPTEVYAPYAVDGNDTSAYIGVSPEYMTYASETDKPMLAEDGVEKQREDAFLEQAVPVVVPAAVESTTTQGQGSTAETVYTATSGESFSAAQSVTEDSGEPATEDVEKPVQPADTAPAATVTSPTSTVDTAVSEDEKTDLEQSVTPPAATTSTPTPPTSTSGTSSSSSS